jgi:hypothetical protein
MFNEIYNQTVTLLNKLRQQDSVTKVDVWHKTIITDAAWYTDSARSAGGQSVYIGTYITVLIPFHDEYIPYLEWRKAGMQEGHYTISNGDYVIKGIVTEEITPNNIVKTLQNYGEDVCLVRHHKTAHNRFGATVQLRIQGV